MVDVLPRQLADVDEAVHAAEVDERTERHDAADHTLADLARLEVGEEAVAALLLGLLEEGPTAQHDVVAVLVELDDLGLHDLADIGLEVADTAQFDQRGREEATEADVDDETALDDLDHRTLDHALGFLDLLDRAPRALVLGTLLAEDQTAFLVLLGEDEGFDLLAHRHDLARVDVVADAQLTRRDDTLALVADVEEDLVLVDLDHGAVDELAVLDVDHLSGDGIGEGHAEIVGDDLTRGVVALLVEGAEGTGGGGGVQGVGQGTIAFGQEHQGSGGFRTRKG